MRMFIAFAMVLAAEMFSVWKFYDRIVNHSQGDGDLGLALFFWLTVAIYAIADLVWAGVLIWKAVRG